MAGVLLEYATGEVAVASGTPMYGNVGAASNHRLLVREFDISADGIVVTDPPILVDLSICSTSSATSGSSQAPVKTNRGDDETVQATGRKADTATGTVQTALRSFEFHPQDGKTVYFDPPIPVKGGDFFQYKVTVGANVNVAVNIRLEE